MENRNSDSPIASSDAEGTLGGADGISDTQGSQLPPGPVVETRSRGVIWIFIALVIVAILIYFAKGMI